MSELIVIAFDQAEAAESAYEKVEELQSDLVVNLSGLALVKVDDQGKTHVTTPASGGIVATGAAGGSLFGVLLGLLFFVPFAGFLFGGLIGGLFAGLDKTGLNREFRSQVQDVLKPGQWALVLYANKVTEDKFAEALEPFHGRLLKTSLSDADERLLADDLR